MKVKVKKELFEGKDILRFHLIRLDDRSNYVVENRSLLHRLALYDAKKLS